jgi:hypothetical protein
MAQNSRPPANHNTPPLSEETVREIIALQRNELTIKQKELEARAEEMRFRGRHIDHERDLAKTSIEAQERDRAGERKHAQTLHIVYAIVGSVITLAVIVLLALIIQEGHAEQVIDVLKMMVSGGVGLAAGYAWGKSKGDSREAESSED